MTKMFPWPLCRGKFWEKYLKGRNYCERISYGTKNCGIKPVSHNFLHKGLTQERLHKNLFSNFDLIFFFLYFRIIPHVQNILNENKSFIFSEFLRLFLSFYVRPYVNNYVQVKQASKIANLE